MDDEQAERGPAPEVAARFARALDDAARSAYGAAHGLLPAPEPARARWRVAPRAAVSAVAALAILAAVGWWGLRPVSPATPAIAGVTPTASATAAAAALVVHVSGAVAAPGLVEVPAGSRVADAIDAAGGLGADADEASVNLARAAVDGEHVVVRRHGEAEEGSGPVDVNAADATRLEALPGIGPALAARIVADRDANGPFATLDELSRVPGIGEAIVGSLAGLASAG